MPLLTAARTSRRLALPSFTGPPTVEPPWAPLRALRLGLGALLAVVAFGCAARVSPPPPPPPAPRVPVVLVPGATGTELLDAASGRPQWGTGLRLLLPRDRGHAVALPLDGSPPAAVPGAVLDDIGFGPSYRRPVYRPVADAFVAAGWVAGDLAAPRPGDTFLTFAYDWRRGATASAAELLAGLERLRAARGDRRLVVDLVCQSSGAHVCRWLAKYGAATLDEAEAGRGGLPPEIAVRRLALVGASNGGSVRIFSMLHRGRRYVSGGRLFAPETLFTFESFYQDLPAGSGRIFVDPEGRPLAPDLYDPEAWVRHGWSVFAPEVARRLEAERTVFGDAAVRRAFLARELSVARRFQAALARDGSLGATRYYLVQEAATPTMRGAVLERDGERWLTWFPGDRAVDRHPMLLRRLTATGDGHATLASQASLSPRERAALGARPLRARGGHFGMIQSREVLRWLVAVLAQEERGEGAGADG